MIQVSSSDLEREIITEKPGELCCQFQSERESPCANPKRISETKSNSCVCVIILFFLCLNWLCYSVVGFLCVFLCRNDQSDKSAEPIEIIQEKKKRKSAV